MILHLDGERITASAAQQAKGELGVYIIMCLKHLLSSHLKHNLGGKEKQTVYVSPVFDVCFSNITYKYTPFLYMLHTKIYMYMYGEICNIYIIIRDLSLLHI